MFNGSYKNAVVTGMSRDVAYKLRQAKFEHDAKLLLNKNHTLFTGKTCSKRCATIILTINIAREHYKFIISNIKYHEVIYKKLVEFQVYLHKCVGLSGNACFCKRINNLPVCHDMSKYISILHTLLVKYKTLNRNLLPAFMVLSRFIPRDLINSIMTYITIVPF